MKKIIAILLSLTLAFSFTACKSDATNTEKKNSSEIGESNNELNSAQDQTDLVSVGKTLVVFYSATGNTKSVANLVAETLSADIFEIIPEKPYTDDDLNWRNDDSRVSVEHDDESKRDVPLTKAIPDNFKEYDTVFIGYPIWWGIAAWPIDGFIQANDLEGKTIVPFCTSASSDLGDSAELLKNKAGTGNWLEGKRFSASPSKEDVEDWLNETFN